MFSYIANAFKKHFIHLLQCRQYLLSEQNPSTPRRMTATLSNIINLFAQKYKQCFFLIHYLSYRANSQTYFERQNGIYLSVIVGGHSRKPGLTIVDCRKKSSSTYTTMCNLLYRFPDMPGKREFCRPPRMQKIMHFALSQTVTEEPAHTVPCIYWSATTLTKRLLTNTAALLESTAFYGKKA